MSRQNVGLLRQLPWALAAMANELLHFRFTYPIEAVTDAMEPGSLNYYIYSNILFQDQLSYDEAGVVVRTYRAQGRQYNPVFIAWCALMNLQRFLGGGDAKHLDIFNNQVRWLKNNAQTRPDGSVVWPYNFDWQEGQCLLKAPWISAMSQGLAISVLVRAYRLNKDDSLLQICEGSRRVFERNIEEGGVKTGENGHSLYEEYPGYPLARVLDGFLFSLLGLHDLSQELPSAINKRLFQDGIEGLKYQLAEWDYRGKWSWYGRHGYLCPPHYHRLNGALIKILGQLTQDEALIRCGMNWTQRKLTFLDKAEIFTLFAITKNLARLRLPRN